MKKLIFIFPLVMCMTCLAQELTKTKNLVVITLDGYRWQEVFKGADSVLLHAEKFNTQDSIDRIRKYWRADASERRRSLMPFLWNHLEKHGRIYGNRDLGNKVNVSNPYWFSYPGYSEIFSGFVDTLINSNKYPDNPNPNVLEFIHQQPGFRNKIAVFSSWVALSRILNEKRSGLMVNAGYEDVAGNHLTEAQKVLNANQHRFSIPLFMKTLRLGSSTYDIAKQYMIQNHPRVMYIAFGDTDHFAHDGQYDFYLDAAHHEDAMIAELWEYIQSDKFYKDKTTVLVTVDHGRGLGDKWISHGKKAPDSDEIWFAIMGPDTKPMGEVKEQQQLWQNQFAATMAALLGLEYNADRQVGNPIQGVRAGQF